MTAPIELYFDLISPYGYLGVSQVERVAAAHGRAIDWCPVLIGVTILKIMGMKPLPQTPIKGPYLNADAIRVAKMLGVPFKHHGLQGVSSLSAMRAFVWLKARDPALAVAFAKRIYERLWVRSMDITSVQAVADEAVALGLNRDDILGALASDDVKAALQSAVELAIAKGVFGVPFFIADGESFWGGDRAPMLDHWLKHHTWAPQP
jgi:2-hydroxychromene-2-carboxylate isomerase